MQKHWIWLSTRKGVGTRGRAALLRLFGTAERIYEMKEQAYLETEGFDRRWLESLLDKSMDGVEEIFAQCELHDIRLVNYASPAYPDRLRNIADPPALLYYKGTLPDFDHEAVIGIVGSRKCSAYGLLHAKQFSKLISNSGGVIVSAAPVGSIPWPFAARWIRSGRWCAFWPAGWTSAILRRTVSCFRKLPPEVVSSANIRRGRRRREEIFLCATG